MKICKILSLSILQNNEKAYWEEDTKDVAKWSFSKEILWAQTLPVWIRGDKDHRKQRKAVSLLCRAEKLAYKYVSPFKKGNDDPKGHPEILRAATMLGQGWYSLLCFQGQGFVLDLWREDALLCPRGGVFAEPSVRGPTEPWGWHRPPVGLDGRTLNQRGISLTFKINRMTLGSFWVCLGFIIAFFLPVSSCEKAKSVLYLTALYPEAHYCLVSQARSFWGILSQAGIGPWVSSASDSDI